jgi:5-formyltetrahydrofolate cyclo-ligase
MSPSDKTTLRKLGLARRQFIAPADHATWSRACVRRLLVLIAELPPARRIVAGYVPFKAELNITPALNALAAEGNTVVLPRVIEGQKELLFYESGGSDALIPSLLIVPLAAFDRSGHRLGYGAGYYDVTLAKLRAQSPPPLAIGVAFAVQEVDPIAAEAFDQRLDMVVTEKEVIRIT